MDSISEKLAKDDLPMTLPSLALGVDPASRDSMDHPPVQSGTLLPIKNKSDLSQ